MRCSIIAWAVLVAFSVTAAAGDIKAEWKEGDAAKRKALEKLEGKPAPPLHVTAWAKGDAVKLEDLRGKVVVLDFWATWCGPCIRSIPHNNDLQRKYKDRGVVFIGVCHPKGCDRAAGVIKDKGIEYSVAVDAEGKTIAAYRVNSYPDYYLIDRDGNLALADCRNNKVAEAVEALLADAPQAARRE